MATEKLNERVEQPLLLLSEELDLLPLQVLQAGSLGGLGGRRGDKRGELSDGRAQVGDVGDVLARGAAATLRRASALDATRKGHEGGLPGARRARTADLDKP